MKEAKDLKLKDAYNAYREAGIEYTLFS